MRSSKFFLVLLVAFVIASSAIFFVALYFAGIGERDSSSPFSNVHSSTHHVVNTRVPSNHSMIHPSTRNESLSSVSAQEYTITEEMTEQVQQVVPPSDSDQAGSVPESHLEYWTKYGQDAYNDALRDLLVNESNQPREESAPGKP